jgi:selenophosphate synthetase-related protein
MKRLSAIIGIFLLGTWIGHAQSTTSQIGSVVAAAHTSCTVTASTTQVCFATDGLWLSVNGAAYVQVQTGAVVAGVTSIAVNGGTPQTGVVSLTIPSKITITSTGALQ